jgi:SSS family solute:Na+ symporter
VTLVGGVGVALFIGNLLDMFKYFISLPAIFGAAIWLGFTWRRVTKAAVIIQIFICFAVYAVIPNLFQSMEWARTRPGFLRQTRPQVLTISTKALREDVEAGRASTVGEMIRKQHVNPPAGIFFENVALTDPANPDSPRIGIGRFQAEIWVLSWTGMDFSGFSKAQLNAVRFGFDALFPFLLLFLLSAVTRAVPKEDLDRFFAKVHTPVQPTPEAEEKALRHAVEHYHEIEKKKLRPGSSWEFMTPVKTDVLGFCGSWLLVGVIILLLWLMVNIK